MGCHGPVLTVDNHIYDCVNSNLHFNQQRNYNNSRKAAPTHLSHANHVTVMQVKPKLVLVWAVLHAQYTGHTKRDLDLLRNKKNVSNGSN